MIYRNFRFQCLSLTIDNNKDVCRCHLISGHPGDCKYEILIESSTNRRVECAAIKRRAEGSEEIFDKDIIGYVCGSDEKINKVIQQPINCYSFPAWCNNFGIIFHSRFKINLKYCEGIDKRHIEDAYVNENDDAAKRIDIYGELTRNLQKQLITPEAK